MKDFEIRFCIKNLFRETPKEVAQLQTYIKATAAFSSLGTWSGFGLVHAAVIAGIGLVIDILLHCVSLHEKK